MPANAGNVQAHAGTATLVPARSRGVYYRPHSTLEASDSCSFFIIGLFPGDVDVHVGTIRAVVRSPELQLQRYIVGERNSNSCYIPIIGVLRPDALASWPRRLTKRKLSYF